jgi:methylated-DNA-protein-cysteine methyltransferase-like protein
MTIETSIIAAIRKIPKGKVSTYGAVARAAGYPRYARQVAHTLRMSAALSLPWHRVVGSGGQIKLTGHAAMEQRFRLQSEGVGFRGRRIDMVRYEFKFRAGRGQGKTNRARPKGVHPPRSGKTNPPRPQNN